MRVLTQTSPYGRHGVAGWSMFRRLGAEGRAWMRRGLLAVLAIWLMALSQGAFALSCSIAFSTPQNTPKTYTLNTSDNNACDPNNVGISTTAGGNDNSASSTTQPSAQGGTLKIYGYWTGTNQLVYTPPSASFTGTDTAMFYVSDLGGTWTQTGTVTITVTSTAPPPTVSGISPTAGPTAGNTNVTITGTNLTGATAVWFGGTPATSFTPTSATSITATSPAQAAGSVHVSVVTPGGTSTTSGADQFSYVAAPTAGPTSIIVAHGSTNNPATVNVTGSPTSLAVGTQATHGTATASGLSLTYTPNSSYSGTDSFTYTATNAGGTSAPATITVTVSNATVTYAPSSPVAGSVGTAYSQSLSPASGGTAPYTYALATGALPAGLSLASNGTLSGTPTAGGTFNFTVTATDSSTGTGPFSTTSGTLTLTVSAPTITVSPASLGNATAASAYSQSLSASGGTSSYTFAPTGGSLPTGLVLNSNGTLSGTPSAAGTFNFTATATDSSTGTGPYTGSRSYSLVVNAPTLAISPVSGSLSATAGTPYSQTFAGSGGTSPYSYNFSINSGTLPTGLTFNAGTGTLSGTPTTAGTVNFTVTATDKTTGTGPFSTSGTYTLTTAAPTITLSPGAVPSGTVGVTYSQGVTASGGTGPYTYAITSGSLPMGLTLNPATGTLSGTPTAGGAFNFTLTATDSNGFTGAHVYSLTINAPTINVNPATLPGATVSTAYSQAVSASGGTAPYTYAITAGSLPLGMTLSSAGVVSGTPTSGGTFNFTVSVTDGSTGSGPYLGSRAYTLIVAAPTLVMTPSSGPLSAAAGTAYSRTFAASGGTSPYNYAIVINSGTLPSGLSFNAGTATLAGTPTSAGTVNFSVTATDNSTGSGPYAVTGNYTLTVSAPTISITPSTLPNPAIAAAYSQTVTASGGTGPYSYTITSGALPTGLTLNTATGTISGTPTAGGTFNFSIKATDANSFNATQVYTVTLGAPTLTLTPPASSFNATLSQAFSQAFTAAGGTGPYQYSLSINSGTLPTGLSFNAGTGTLAGTPTAAGTVTFKVTATDSSTGAGPYSIFAIYTLTAAAPVITVSPSTLPGGSVGTVYSQTATASGGTAPYTYAVTTGALPVGLSLNPGTGAISGTPTAGGTFNFSVTATDANSYTGTRNFTQVIAPAVIVVSPTTVPGATVGSAYSQSVSASGGTLPYTYAVTAGALPAGMTLSSAGVLSGTPTAGGNFSFTISSTDSSTGTGAPYTGGRAYTLSVASPTLTITPASGALNGVAGTAYSRNFSAGGGISPYTYVMAVSSGTLPAGLSWNASTATLSGTPITAGTVNFTVTATDSSSGSGPYAVVGTYALTVSAPTIAVAPATLPNPAIATAYNQTVTASGGVAPYTYAITTGALPAGLTLSSSGVLSGTSTAGGAFTFTVTATDANSFTATRSYSVTIGAPTVAVSPAAVTAAQVTTAYSQTFSAAGGTAPYTYAVSSGTLPPGLSLNTSTGVLSGTPTTLGTSAFIVRATDSSTGTGAPYSGTRSYSIVVGQVIGTAPAVTVTTLSNAPVTVHATANATGGPFSSIAIVSPPATGTAVINGLDIVYTPALTTSGAVNFTYALINTAGTSAPIPVTVNVNGVPIAAGQKQATTSSGQAVSVDLTEGATGGPFTGAALVSVVPSNAGTASIVQKAVQTPAGVKTPAAAASTYMLNFTPAGTYSGPAVLTYTLSNAYATSMPATVQVSVTARKDPSADPDVAGLINAQIQAARRFATTQIDNYNRRLEALHGTGRAPSDNGLTVAMPGARAADAQARCQDVAGIAARDACLRGDGQGVRPFARGKRNPDAIKDGNGDKSNADAGPDLPGADAAGTAADSTDPRLAFWSAGTLDFGFANTGIQRSGFRFTTGGVTAGADYRVSDQLSVGAGFGYGRDSTDIGNAGTKSTGDSYSLALYGSYRPQPSVFVDGVAGFGTLSFDSRRWVTDASDFATGRRNGKQMFASVSAGYEHRDRTWLISPYGRLSVSQSTLDQFSESGAGINALTYFEQIVTTVSGTLGLRAEYTQKTKWGTFLPFARVEYQHDFNGQSNAGLAYADLASSGPAYYVPGTPFGRDRVQIGLGTKFRTGPLTFGLDYNVMTGMGGLQQGVRLTFSAPF